MLLLTLTLSACRPIPPTVALSDPRTIEDVRLEGFDVLDPDALAELRDDLPLRAGDPLTDEHEQAAGNSAVAALQNSGYPYARVALAREPVAAEAVRLILRADPGPPGFFGRIDIAGNRTVDDRIIRTRVAYAPGDRFSRTAIEQTQQRLGALGLFKSIEIRAEGSDVGPSATTSVEVPTLIAVEERTPWHWNLGVGYGAGDRIAVDARLSHVNFLGSARRLDLEGRLSAIERSAGVAFTQTDAWHPALALSLEARHREIDERSFFVLTRGGQASASWQWSRELSTSASYAVSLERSDVARGLELLAGLQDGMLSAWSIDVDHRRLRSGLPNHIAVVHVEQAGGWMPGTFNYFSLVGDGRSYRRFANGMVLAGRVRYGATEPFAAEADIPLLKRFFLGGSSEMRGWSIYEVGPLSASGEPVGGKSFFTATAELRFPIAGRVSGALFAEAGNAWQDSWAMRPRDLLYDAGPGLRVDTPFGLIRLDAGYQLRPLDGLRIDGRPQKHRWRINFGIGEAF